MALHQCWLTTKNEFFERKEHSWLKVNYRQGGFPAKFQVLGWRHIKLFLTYVQLAFMLHYRIHGFFTYGINSLEDVSELRFSSEY